MVRFSGRRVWGQRPGQPDGHGNRYPQAENKQLSVKQKEIYKFERIFMQA
jgi:hypothetical protein